MKIDLGYTEQDLLRYLDKARTAIDDVGCDVQYPIPLNGTLLDEDEADLQIIAWLEDVRGHLTLASSALGRIGLHIRRKEKQEI